jgi:hypothetical protein
MRKNVILSDSEESIPSRFKDSRFGVEILSFDQPGMDSSFRFAPFRPVLSLPKE